MRPPIIGILALQGDFAEHCRSIESAGAKAIEVRYLSQLKDLDGLVIPGGESTTIAKFNEASHGTIFGEIRRLARSGMPIYGTCMGTVVLASRIESLQGEPTNQERLGLMNIAVKRNAYGPQRASFECEIAVSVLGEKPFPAVFIRAPQISWCGPEVQSLATIGDATIMARQKNLLVTTFHPEISGDLRVHEYFVSIVRETMKGAEKTQAPGARQLPDGSKAAELAKSEPRVAV